MLCFSMLQAKWVHTVAVCQVWGDFAAAKTCCLLDWSVTCSCVLGVRNVAEHLCLPLDFVRTVAEPFVLLEQQAFVL